MNGFSAFVKKEFEHVFRDKRTMLILLGIPVAMIVLFGFAISTEIRNVNVAVLAPQQDEVVRQIVAKMDAGEYFTVRGFLDSGSDIDEAFQDGLTDLVVVFGDGFGNGLYSPEGSEIQLIADASNTNTAAAVTMYASGVIQDYVTEIAHIDGGMGIEPNMRMLYNPQMKSSYDFVPGIMGLIIILICAMMTSVSIVREKETGTMELLLVSPVKPIIIVISKMVPYMVVSFVSFLMILLLSATLLDVPVSGRFWELCLLSIIYITVALALGLLISTKTESQLAAMLGSGMVLMMPMMFFSGMIFPVESMPGFFRMISKVIPATWYIEGTKKLMIEGLPIHYVWKEFTVLSGMAVLLIVVSLKSFRYRL